MGTSFFWLLKLDYQQSVDKRKSDRRTTNGLNTGEYG